MPPPTHRDKLYRERLSFTAQSFQTQLPGQLEKCIAQYLFQWDMYAFSQTAVKGYYGGIQENRYRGHKNPPTKS